MHEVIFSYFHDKFIARPVCTFSSVKPHFIGSKVECLAWLARNA
jgi:hypothetical protein